VTSGKDVTGEAGEHLCVPVGAGRGSGDVVQTNGGMTAAAGVGRDVDHMATQEGAGRLHWYFSSEDRIDPSSSIADM